MTRPTGRAPGRPRRGTEAASTQVTVHLEPAVLMCAQIAAEIDGMKLAPWLARVIGAAVKDRGLAGPS